MIKGKAPWGAFYLFAFIIVAAGMPQANILMSIGTILLMLIWFIEGGYKAKFQQLYTNLPAMLLIGLFLLHLVWLVNTKDFSYAFKDLRIKLPLLVLPLVLGSVRISSKTFYRVLTVFCLSCLVAILHVIFNFCALDNRNVYDARALVEGISHIRLALMVVLAIVIILLNIGRLSTLGKVSGGVFVLSSLYFLNLIQSSTGYSILFLVVLVLAIWKLVLLKKRKAAFIVFCTGFIIFALGAFTLFRSYQKFYTTDESMLSLPKTTKEGGAYTHYTDIKQVENGHYVWLYINYEELQKSWNQRSEKKIDYFKPGREMLESGLIRYLASRGLSRDTEGIEQLKEEDIEAIEDGIPSVAYHRSIGVTLRLQKILFDIHMYRIYGDPSGNSISQRFEYWKTAAHIISRNWITGVGTGDVQESFTAAYKRTNTKLRPEYWRRAHNQYLTFFISFGVLGGVFFLFVFLAPFKLQELRQSLLWVAFIFIAALSCTAEDTLETQAGATFFSFFYAFFSAYILTNSSKDNPAPPAV